MSCRLTGVEAMGKVIAAWSNAPLHPDIPEALRHMNNAGIKVRWGLLGLDSSALVFMLDACSPALSWQRRVKESRDKGVLWLVCKRLES